MPFLDACPWQVRRARRQARRVAGQREARPESKEAERPQQPLPKLSGPSFRRHGRPAHQAQQKARGAWQVQCYASPGSGISQWEREQNPCPRVQNLKC